MKDKFSTAIFCLLFAVLFGGVGLGATWIIGTTVYDGSRAQDWVRVKATVDAVDETSVNYHYTFQGREYTGDRLGAVPIGGRDNIDDWGEELYGRISAAKADGRPITVLVDPVKPSDSMVDAEIRWRFLIFLLPFSLAFGGVGVGALYMMTRLFRDAPRRRASPASNATQGIAGLWIFAFFWNSISFPIAMLLVPEMIDQGEWLGLLVMIFPLIGLALAWAALRSTWLYLRRGGASLKLRAGEARAGSTVEGTVDFARGVKGGDRFNVNLLCRRSTSQDGDTSTSAHWTRQIAAKATQAADGGARLPFRFEVPATLPGSGDEDNETFQWRIEVNAAGPQGALRGVDRPLPMPYGGPPRSVAWGFDLEMLPARSPSPAVAFVADPVPATLGPPHATLHGGPPHATLHGGPPHATLHGGPGFESVEKLLGLDASRLSAEQRAALTAMTAEQRAALGKIVAFAPLARKAAVIVGVILAALFILPFVIALFTNS